VMTLFNVKIQIFFLTLVFLISTTSISNGAENYAESLFNKANESYEKGLSLEGEARQNELKITAMNYEKIIEQAGIQNGYLYYNLGNTYFHLNELGKAIVNYRRAQRFIPNFPDLRENLRTAMSKRQDRIDKTQIESIWRTLFFWHYLIGMKGKVIIFEVFFILIWILLFIRLYRNTLLLKWAAVLSILFAVSFGISLVIEKYEQNTIKCGVIISKETDAKKAPYANAPSEFLKPLHEGTEFEVIEERSGWIKVKLDDGKTTWLPASSCEII
jgi:tetratricopeptide (TPR) repeat protein